MKRNLLLLGLVGVVLFSAAPVLADDGFYVIPTRATPGTAITSLPHTITATGYYYLTRNLTSTGGMGITVNADNVTIDLMGFTLSGTTTGTGILTTRNNVEIRNGTVSGWQFGVIQNSPGTGARAIGVRAVGNTYGIRLSDHALIKGCTASPGSIIMGIGLGVTSGTISGCTVMDFSPSDSTTGQIYVGSGRASDNLVINCAAIGIRGFGPTTISNNAVINCSTGIGNEGGGSITGNAVKANTGQTGIAPATYVDPDNIATPSLLDQNSVNGDGTHYGPVNSATVKGLNSP